MAKGRKTDWTPEMIQKLKDEFPTRFNKELASELGIGWRTLVRKARELGVDKEEGFLDKNRDTITQMATEAKPRNPMLGVRGWSVPGGEAFRFKPGNVPKMKTDPDLVQRVHQTRNETIKRDKLRRKYGLTPITKFKRLG